MNPHKAFDRGMLAGILLMLGGHAGHWFIAYGHPGSGAVRTVLVAVQLVAGFGGAVWLILQRRRYLGSAV